MNDLIALAKQAATAANLDPALVCAVCEQESAWSPWAIRYEPAFYAKYIIPLGLSDDTEARVRAVSWGLMQLIGETAREEGFVGPMASLCDPATGLERGLVHLKRCLQRAAGNVPMALQFWNGGGNPQYAAQVMARMSKYGV